MLRILNSRIRGRLKKKIRKEYRFRKEVGTRDIIGLFTVIGKRYMEKSERVQ